MIRIALDAMGGDNAPDAICEGALLALKEFSDITIQLYGPEALLRQKTAGAGAEIKDRLEIIDAPDVIDMHDAPMLAVRKKTESSMVKAAMAVREGKADAFVSAGSTGAVLACGMLRIGRIKGIERPALAVVYPGAEKPFLLLDSGANVDCQSKWLVQFGLMGAAYMRAFFDIEDPEVRLANIGAEETKGNRMTQEAYGLLAKQKAFRFAGNIEAREVPFGKADVVVCDGFDGNIILKLTEGLAGAMFGLMKVDMLATLRGKIGALLVKPSLKKFKGRLDSEKYGGAPLLGVNGALIKAHGNATATAIMNAAGQARKMVQGGVVARIQKGVEELAALDTAEDNNDNT
ncbi:MAG: phosphate acyltransferase PlsX [Eubacteriales bacterium]|nr:phosphate acyltransferase PlsX [Eubacteriales bacterium]